MKIENAVVMSKCIYSVSLYYYFSFLNPQIFIPIYLSVDVSFCHSYFFRYINFKENAKEVN